MSDIGMPTYLLAAAGGATAVEALVTAAVSHHDAAAVGAAGGVGAHREGDLDVAAEVQRLDRRAGNRSCRRSAVRVAIGRRVAVGEYGEVGAANSFRLRRKSGIGC